MIRKLVADRFSLMLIAAIFLLVSAIISVSVIAGGAEKRNRILRAQLTEINQLSEGLLQLKNAVRGKEKKIGLTGSTGVVSTMEQILRGLGLEASMIKPLEKKHVKEFLEQDVELEIKGIDLNSIVNLLYKVENAPQPLKIKSAFIRTSFENTDRFILKLTASLVGRG